MRGVSMTLLDYFDEHPVSVCQEGCEYWYEIKGLCEAVRRDPSRILRLKQVVMSAVADGHLEWTAQLRQLIDEQAEER